MPLSPEDFYAHAVAAADEEQRLPLSRMTGWDISPFEADGLRVSPLRPPVLPEPARHGEDPADCDSCRRRDEGIWLDDHWRLTRIAGVGVPLGRPAPRVPVRPRRYRCHRRRRRPHCVVRRIARSELMTGPAGGVG
jgi:transposase